MPRQGRFRYGVWHGGPDPLEAPYDLAEVVDSLGDRVLAGESPQEALAELLRRGTQGRAGLEDLMRQVQQRRREAREAGRLDGTLERVRELLDTAVEAERSRLAFDTDDGARTRELELDTLPGDTARAVRALREYDWRDADARAAYEELTSLLREEVLDSRFRGMKDALQAAADGTDDGAMDRVKDMMADLNAMLAADARGEHTPEQFAEFMARHGEFFPDDPADLDELVDALARRAAAASRLMSSLSPEQRDELANLMATAMEDLGLASEMSALSQALQAKRPDLQWGGRQRMDGDTPLGLGDATTALEELADLDSLAAALEQDYPGASLDDIDAEAVERALGRAAVDDLAALREIERELERQGYLQRGDDGLELSARAVRRLGRTALRRVFADLTAAGRGQHDIADAGAAGELTGASRAWQFGDEQPLDVVRTVRNAVLRAGVAPDGVRLHVDDFEVVETERRTTAAVALLVDLSYSMALRGTWGVAKSTALALHSLVTTGFPQDSIEIIGFSDYARVLQPAELAGLNWDMVQGTNLQHALMIANRFLARHPDSEPVILCVTDGEPTAHLTRDGRPYFDWPPAPETLELTMAEVEKVTRRGATLNVFMLDDEPRLVRFVEGLARRNGGRVFSPAADRLGEYVVSDYLRARRGRRG